MIKRLKNRAINLLPSRVGFFIDFCLFNPDYYLRKIAKIKRFFKRTYRAYLIKRYNHIIDKNAIIKNRGCL